MATGQSACIIAAPFFCESCWQLMVPCGRPQLPTTKSLPLGILEEKKHSVSSKILCSSLERILDTPEERWDGGESKLGSQQVVNSEPQLQLSCIYSLVPKIVRWWKAMLCVQILFDVLTNLMGPSGRFRLSLVEFYLPRLWCESCGNFFSEWFISSINWSIARKMVEDGVEEDIWKRHDFGNDPLLMGPHKSKQVFKENWLAVSFPRQKVHINPT